jgi:hypothetical protein
LLTEARQFFHKEVSCKFRVDVPDSARQYHVLVKSSLNLAAGMQNRGVVPAAKVAANLLQGESSKSSGQVHAHLTRHQHTSSSRWPLDLSRFNVKIATDALDDAINGKSATMLRGVELTLNHLEFRDAAVQPTECLDLANGALHLPKTTIGLFDKPGKQRVGQNNTARSSKSR